MSTLEILRKASVRRPKLITLADTGVLSRVTEFVPTGCPPLDLIMGGGVPVGRMTEIYGDTSTGKTLLAEHIIAQTQAIGGTAALLDTETAIDADVAKVVGIDLDKLIYTNPETVEDVYADIQELLEAKRDVDPKGLMTIVWDSVAATSSEEEIEKIRKEGLGAHTMATHARLISTMMRVMKQEVARDHVALIMLNQTRQNIGVMFGDKMSIFGGRAIGYYSSVRLELALRGQIKDRGNVIGIEVRAYVAKSKVAPPFGKCIFPILFNVGIDEPGAMLNWLKDEKIAVTRGAWTYLTLDGGKELQFQGASWAEMYNDNHAAILGLMYEEEPDGQVEV